MNVIKNCKMVLTNQNEKDKRKYTTKGNVVTLYKFSLIDGKLEDANKKGRNE